MLEKIKYFESKGLRIGFYPILEKESYQWVAYVMIGGKRNWLKGDPECTMSAFNSIDRALEAAIAFCDKNYAKKK